VGPSPQTVPCTEPLRHCAKPFPHCAKPFQHCPKPFRHCAKPFPPLCKTVPALLNRSRNARDCSGRICPRRPHARPTPQAGTSLKTQIRRCRGSAPPAPPGARTPPPPPLPRPPSCTFLSLLHRLGLAPATPSTPSSHPSRGTYHLKREQKSQQTQGLTIVHFSAQLEPCLAQEDTLHTP
jgi:hypothetical protein